jgi:hypothetical protein
VGNPAGQVALPSLHEGLSAPTGEVTFFAPDMTSGAFVAVAPNLASLELPANSPLSRRAILTCQVRADSAEGLIYLISQVHPTRQGDSVHLAFLQAVTTGEVAFRAGAFAGTRALRDSLIGALMAFHPVSKQ